MKHKPDDPWLIQKLFQFEFKVVWVLCGKRENVWHQYVPDESNTDEIQWNQTMKYLPSWEYCRRVVSYQTLFVIQYDQYESCL